MKILVVTDAIPFPPYNGKQLPIAKIFTELSQRHNVHLLILNTKKNLNTEPQKQIPAAIKYLGAVETKRNTSAKRTFTNAFASFDYSLHETLKAVGTNYYDYIWISPVTHYAFAVFCKENGLRFFNKMAIGLNDSKTFQYRDSINEMLLSRIFKWRYVTYWLRSFFIAQEEKKYLELADIIHVQTAAEKNKLIDIAGDDAAKKIIAAPNGVKEELFGCTYNSKSSYILYMTHLDGDRMQESKWFLQKVWQRIKKQIPNAKLVIAGKPPQQPLPFIQNDASIIVNGYAADLKALYENARLAVVPTFHGTGLINRILDALCAGVPVVATPQAAATFQGLRHSEEILAAQQPALFAEKVVQLFNDGALCMQLSHNGRSYAKKFPTWQQTAAVIEKKLSDTITEL